MSRVTGALHRRDSGAPPSIRSFATGYGLTGAGATDEVFGSAAPVVVQQAENRLHTTEALLVAALGR